NLSIMWFESMSGAKQQPLIPFELWLLRRPPPRDFNWPGRSRPIAPQCENLGDQELNRGCKDLDAGVRRWRNMTFVNYLRKAFEWAGFPGWERDPNPPREMISKLTEGLLAL